MMKERGVRRCVAHMVWHAQDQGEEMDELEGGSGGHVDVLGKLGELPLEGVGVGFGATECQPDDGGRRICSDPLFLLGGHRWINDMPWFISEWRGNGIDQQWEQITDAHWSEKSEREDQRGSASAVAARDADD